MIIQSNMSPKAIVQVWENTIDIFNKYHFSPSSNQTLDILVAKDILPTLLFELNHSVGSSGETCIEGG